MKIFFETAVPQPWQKIRDMFDRDLFTYLKPPGVDVEILRFDGCKKDDEIHLDIHLMGRRQRWVSLVTEALSTENGWHFVDEGKVVPWPVRTWRHVHRVEKVDEQNSKIIDDITYQCEPEWIAPLVAPVMWLSFAIRPHRYQAFFRKDV